MVPWWHVTSNSLICHLATMAQCHVILEAVRDRTSTYTDACANSRVHMFPDSTAGPFGGPRGLLNSGYHPSGARHSVLLSSQGA